jgi:hypothetical protein
LHIESRPPGGQSEADPRHVDPQVIEYCRFQPGIFLDYAAHPYTEAKYLSTFPLLVDIEERHANLLEAGVDDLMSATSVEDIAHVVALAVEYEGEWPTIGGIRGSSLTLTQLLRIGESIQGRQRSHSSRPLAPLARGIG